MPVVQAPPPHAELHAIRLRRMEEGERGQDGHGDRGECADGGPIRCQLHPVSPYRSDCSQKHKRSERREEDVERAIFVDGRHPRQAPGAVGAQAER